MCCPHNQRAVPKWASCNLPVMCLQACDFLKSVIVQSLKIRRGYDAPESVQWLHERVIWTSYWYPKLIGRQM